MGALLRLRKFKETTIQQLKSNHGVPHYVYVSSQTHASINETYPLQCSEQVNGPVKLAPMLQQEVHVKPQWCHALLNCNNGISLY